MKRRKSQKPEKRKMRKKDTDSTRGRQKSEKLKQAGTKG